MTRIRSFNVTAYNTFGSGTDWGPAIYQAEHLIQKRQFAMQDIGVIDGNLYREIAASWRRYEGELAVSAS